MTDITFIGLYIVIAPYSIPIAHNAKSMDKTNWISFIIVKFESLFP